MKRSASITAKITLGLLIAGTVVACKQTPTQTKPVAVPVDAKATIVYVNQDSLTAKYKSAIDMRKRLEDKSKSLQGEVKAKQDAFQREYLEAQKNAATMTQDQQKALSEKLQRDQATFQQFQQNASSEFQTVSGDETKKLYDKIVEFTKTYAKSKGYKMILTYQNGNVAMLYGDPSLDITADFLKSLNDAADKK